MIDPTPIPGYPDYGATPNGRIFSRKRGAWRELKSHPKGKGGDYLKIKLYTSPGFYDQIAVHTLIALTFIGPKPVGPAGTIIEVNHKDFNKRNNKVGNLEWLTQIENAEHAIAGGRCQPRLTKEQRIARNQRRRAAKRRQDRRRRARKRAAKIAAGWTPKRLIGVEMANHVLTERDVRAIRARWRPSINGTGSGTRTQPNSLGALAAEYGVTKQTVWRIVHGARWRHVPGLDPLAASSRRAGSRGKRTR